MASSSVMEQEYSIFSKDFIERIEDQDWFVESIKRRSRRTAAKYSCSITFSNRRMRQVHKYFIEEIRRNIAENMPKGTITLDQYKMAAYLCFWLRRIVPIERVQFTLANVERAALHRGDFSAISKQQDFFAHYGNEIAAFETGFLIALYGFDAEIKRAISRQDGQVVEMSLRELIASVTLPAALVQEAVVTLKHKSNSPHSIYITLLSLFNGPGLRADRRNG